MRYIMVLCRNNHGDLPIGHNVNAELLLKSLLLSQGMVMVWAHITNVCKFWLRILQRNWLLSHIMLYMQACHVHITCIILFRHHKNDTHAFKKASKIKAV